MIDKILQLKKLESKMIKDVKLPLSANLIFGEGSPDCKVLFIGEAPGAKEDELIRPFVGRSGQLLRKSICNLGWQESEVYITNIVKRRPPKNRDPLPKEIQAYQPYLTLQIEIINPKIIVPLGRFSARYFLPNIKISRDQGKIFPVGNWQILPMLHPAAALRSKVMMAKFKKSFSNLPVILRNLKLNV